MAKKLQVLGEGLNGTDGVSPIISTEVTQKGTKVNITDVEGLKTFEVLNGKDGKDGQDGYTPVKGVDYFDGEPGADGKDYVLNDDDRTEIAELAAELVEVPESSGGGIAVTGATPGQTVKIAEVDENGVPTAWEPVEFPSGGGEKEWELIADMTVEEDVALIKIPFDAPMKDVVINANLILNDAENTLDSSKQIYSVVVREPMSISYIFQYVTNTARSIINMWVEQEGFINGHLAYLNNWKSQTMLGPTYYRKFDSMDFVGIYAGGNTFIKAGSTISVFGRRK